MNGKPDPAPFEVYEDFAIGFIGNGTGNLILCCGKPDCFNHGIPFSLWTKPWSCFSPDCIDKCVGEDGRYGVPPVKNPKFILQKWANVCERAWRVSELAELFINSN